MTSDTPSNGPPSHADVYVRALEQLRRDNMLREVGSQARQADGHLIPAAGQSCVSFCLNDYLGLSRHPGVLDAARKAMENQGAGTAASMVAGGHRPIHGALETALAQFKGTEDCRVTSSGYTAALAAIQALIQLPDGTTRPVIFDRLSHACLIDGIRLYGQPRQWKSFRHNDMDDLERQLQSSTPTAPSPLVVVEGLYSMDGDDPPLSEILALCEQYGAWLLIDDAHATGTRGIGGRGSLRTRDLDITARPIVIMGTLSKALGSQGGFVAGPRAVIEWMTNVSRAYLFDTGLAPASAGAALAACKILAEEPHRVDGLREEGARWASEIQALLRTQSQPELISLLGSQVRGPIFPLVTGSAERTLSLRNHLLVRGFQTAAIRPPTVRPGSSRIRLAVCAYHPPEVRDQFIQALAEWMDSGPSEET